ncbi:tail protein [Erwinia phage pEa_SNUABM_16]|uniref:Uncharacterized protein n=1 Tax=Erwinia phage pEa_SNUABM_16 TaxID=2869544 RepID=A0AAE9BUY7_9CAUD|nr:tail protein [Erwinia phage pEa_SNUABM_16]QZE59017.1 hypothetical protein pEaSNUABM18_00114 [Erwinia phage pEa_SNUABM_18]UAW96258.1 hypothetical protein pEaSNUABM16_00114 [Erwinia phage pEa_SNUABM_16]
MKTNTLAFNIDFIESNPAWAELFEMLDAHNDEQNLTVIQQLLDLRRITADTNDELAEAAIRQLGINITRDLMQYRLPSLKRVIDCLPDWQQVSGTTQWPKFVGMLLGGQFDSTRLYTADYQTFVPTPLGTLIQDGGTWYKTNKVNLEVDAHLIDGGLDLTITKDAEQDVVNALQEVGMTQQEAEDWFNNHIGFEPVNNDVEQYTARSAMFQRRIADLFYQWAPIEEVLEGVYAAINIGAKLYLGAHVVVEPVRRFNIGRPIQSSIAFIQPEFIRGGEWTTFGAVISYSDNTEETVEVWVEDSDWIAERDGNAVRFNEPLAISVINLNLTYNGTSQPLESRIYPMGVEPDPDELTIECPTLYGNASAKVRVYGKYLATGSTKELTDSGMIALSSSLGTFNGTTLNLPSVDADTKIDINVKYQGQFDMSQTKEFDVNRSVKDLVPTELRIIVDDEIPQGEEFSLRYAVTYNDGTSKLGVAQARTTSEHTEIVENVLKSKVMRQDYMTSIYAAFGDVVPVEAVKQVVLKAPEINLATIDIIVPDTVVERDIIRPKAMALYVLASATAEQIAARDPTIVVAYTEVFGVWFSSEDSATGVNALPRVDQQTGEFEAPLVDGNALPYALNFSYIEGSGVQTFNRIIMINDTIMIPKSVDLRSSPTISSGSTLMLPIMCLWNNGLSYAAAAAATVEYLPSDSAREEARARTIRLQQQAVEQGQDPSQFDPDNPDYARWVTLNISFSTIDVYDPVMKRSVKEYVLYYQGDLHGSARVHLTYEFEGTTLTNYRDLQLIPVRSLVDSITIECPDTMYEKSRTFVRLLATYVDGSQEYVTAAEWTGNWPEKNEDEYKFLQFSPGRYSGSAVVEIIEGRAPADYKDFRSMDVSKLPMFNAIGSLADLDKAYYDGAILQTGKSLTDYDTYTQVIASFFRVSNKIDLIVSPAPKQSINNIINSRIEGATQISAGVLNESYTLVNTYKTGGVMRTLDGSYAEETPRTFDLEVDSEWSVVQNYYTQDGPNNTQVLIPTTDVVAEIDAEGTLTPSQNVNGAVMLRARYTCDQYQIEKTLLVFLVQANTYLRQIGIVGPDVVWDVSDRNPTIGYENGRWYVPYSLRVIIDPDDEFLSTDAIWSIGDETNVDGVSIDPLNGHLFIGQSQLSDGQIGLRAVFTKQNPQSLADETITGTRTIQLQTQNTILNGYIENPAGNINPNTDYRFIAYYQRRSGAGGSSAIPDANSVKFKWNVINSVSGFSLAQDGTFRFPASKDPQTVKVECIITEQRTEISLVQEITCPGVGFPQDLTVGGYTNVRDDSSMQMNALLGRTGTFVKDDVSAKCLWQITNSKGDVVDVQGISINAQTGRLTIGLLLNDTDFGVKALYIEGQQRLTQTHFMKAMSSYPRFGIAPFGITGVSIALAQLPTRLRSNNGGQFVLSTKTDEYGYFVVRQSYGQAVFAAAADSTGAVNKGWLGFDGAQWPVTGDNGKKGPIVGKVVYDNLTENVLIYRTNARAFGTAVITVRYQ